MKIIVLNGSPKGMQSVTMQYVEYIRKRFPSHDLKILNISQQIARIERDAKIFAGIIDEVRGADGVIWAFPLYYLLVPSQYKRFIELISERGAGEAFGDNHAAVLTTSIHFLDHMAHNYMQAVCDDLTCVHGLVSADMTTCTTRACAACWRSLLGLLEAVGSIPVESSARRPPAGFRYELKADVRTATSGRKSGGH
jgi:NAD(P)H-dependent FMN reductase